jgi:hypothetical protein
MHKFNTNNSACLNFGYSNQNWHVAGKDIKENFTGIPAEE